MKKLLVAFLSLSAWLALPLAAAEAPSNFAMHESPKPMPEIRFEDGEGSAWSASSPRS